MTAAWIAIAVIGIGLPLAAWWVGGRPVWARSDQRARRAQEAHREWIARHGLSSADVAEIQRAIVRGAVLEDERLRPAAVEEARTQLAVWGARGAVNQRVQLVLAVVWLTLTVGLVVLSVVTGEWSWNYLVITVNFLAVSVPQAVLRRNLRRAVELNSRTPAP